MSDTRNTNGNHRPVPVRDLERVFRSRPAQRKALIDRTNRIFVRGSENPPTVVTKVVPTRREENAGEGIDYEVIIDVQGVRPGVRARPPALTGDGVKPQARERDEAELERILTGFIPEHLAFNSMPIQRVKPFRRIRPDYERDRKVATTVFPPDNRMVFQDTHYPWSTVGLVETNRGSGSGVVIGPRHLLTVSHIIDWTAPSGFAADWVRFTPSYFDGDAPFGEAYGAHIYWYLQEDGDGFISGDEGLYDYVVVVLDQRIGELTGWMGARGYDDDWDNLDVWSHMGYPGDLNSGQRPVFQGGFRLDGSDDAAQELLHTGDVCPGQSGGPMFGWWEGDVGPRAVAVQSWQSTANNGASGGMDLRDLVALARTEFA